MVQRAFRESEIVEQLRALGVEAGGVLLVHTSFRALRPIESGPLGLIATLRTALGPDGTLVMPSWTGDDAAPFDPATTPAAPDLGVTADLFWRQPGVVRSDHAFACAAIGPKAEAIVKTALPLPPHTPDSPVGRVRDHDGQVLLLGVGHDADTSLHVAELLTPVPYGVPKHFTGRGDDGRSIRVDYRENDHCCQRFALADGWLRARGLQAEGPVGHGTARLARAQDIVRLAVDALRDEPLLFLHGAEEGCAECDEARASVSAERVP